MLTIIELAAREDGGRGLQSQSHRTECWLGLCRVSLRHSRSRSPAPTRFWIFCWGWIQMSDRLQRAEQFRRVLQLFASSLAEDQALEVPTIFPVYQVGVSYAAGDYVTCGVNGVGDPQLYKVVQAHTSAEEWPPASTPALYTPLGLNDAGYPVWQQPSGAHDAYNRGDIVEYQGVLYKSLVDGNVWAPDAYAEGWEVYADDEQS